MIAEVPLNKMPNQEVSIVLDDTMYDIEIKQGANNNMFISIKTDTQTLISSFPLTVNMPIITRQDKQVTGNFYMFSFKEGYPSYEDFGDSCILVYVSADEAEIL